LYARRAYERAVEQRPVRLVEHEPGFVTGYDDSGRSEALDPDDYDDTRTAHKLRTVTGLRWPAPGLAQRTIRQIRRGR